MAKIALLIGVSEYGAGLKPLPSSLNDVDAMQRVLTHPEMGGFAEADLKVLRNPQCQVMREAIEELFAARHKDDLVLLYFSGHGVKDDRGKLFLTTTITRKNERGDLMRSTAVTATFLHESMNQSRSKRQVIVLDCCYSGAIARGMTVKDDEGVNLQAYLGGKGRAILTSSTSTEYSFGAEAAASGEVGLSVYTRYLVEGIETGAADGDGDGWIAVNELHDYAANQVAEAAPAMTPKFYPVEEGYKIILARSPQDEPKLKYRKEVQARAKQGKGKLSLFAQRLLIGKRGEWGITAAEAEAIEAEVLQPYRDYERKRQEYEQALTEAAQSEYPFSELSRRDLREYQQYLGLRETDIAEIHERVLVPFQVEQERQQQEDEHLVIAMPPAQPPALALPESPAVEKATSKASPLRIQQIEAKLAHEREQLGSLEQNRDALSEQLRYTNNVMIRKNLERQLEALEAEIDTALTRYEETGQMWSALTGSDVPSRTARTNRKEVTEIQLAKSSGSDVPLHSPDGYHKAGPDCPDVMAPLQEPEFQKFRFEVVYIESIENTGFLGLGKPIVNLNFIQGSADYFSEVLGDGVTLEMVSIPGGEFLMGSPEDELGRCQNESPQHRVKMQPFFIGKYPITQAQWKALATLPKIERTLAPDPSRFKDDEHPVENVSWYDAVEFCARLSQQTGREYRLPSEAEWEYACRAGTSTPFHFGETITTDLANYNGNSYDNAPEGEYRGGTTPVGIFPANAFGLFDMHGNISEWCADSWHGKYGGVSYVAAILLSSNESPDRIKRGGDWFISSTYCRSAYRKGNDADDRSDFVGFRVACSAVRTLT